MPTLRALLVLLSLLTLSAHAQQRVDATIVVDGLPRQFIVAVPSGPVPDGGYPLVFMFHGTSGDGERFYTHSGWKELGEQRKIVTVFPSSLEYCVTEDGQRKRTTKWNCGDLVEVGCEGQTYADDVKFVRMMVDTIASLLPIDASRVFASGFSNGGCFVSKLAVDASDLVAAVAASGGGLHQIDSGAPARKIPVAFSIGTLDDRVTVPYGVPELPFNDSVLVYVNRVASKYRGVLALDTTSVRVQTPGTITWSYTTPLPGSTGGSFSFTLVKGLAHQYPNGSNHPLNAPEVTWRFYESVSQPTSAPGTPTMPLRLDLSSLER